MALQSSPSRVVSRTYAKPLGGTQKSYQNLSTLDEPIEEAQRSLVLVFHRTLNISFKKKTEIDS